MLTGRCSSWISHFKWLQWPKESSSSATQEVT
jgi:hypothetical protein